MRRATAAPIVIGIDHDLDLVTADADVAAGEELLNAVRGRIESANECVKIVLVVGDFRFRLDARIGVFDGPELPELADGRRETPDFIAVLPVDDGRIRRALRRGSSGERRRRWWRGRPPGLESKDDGGDRRKRRHEMSRGMRLFL